MVLCPVDIYVAISFQPIPGGSSRLLYKLGYHHAASPPEWTAYTTTGPIITDLISDQMAKQCGGL